MKDCDIFMGVKTYSDPSYIFSGGQDPQPLPRVYAPAHSMNKQQANFARWSNWAREKFSESASATLRALAKILWHESWRAICLR